MRDGDDLVTVLDVPAPLAALGGDLPVEVLGGETLDVRVPTGTQPGEIVTVEHQGMPQLRRPDRRGDLRVVINVTIPRRLRPEQREMLETFADIAHPGEPRRPRGHDREAAAALRRPPMIRLALRVRREDAEIALAELLEYAPSGVEERDLGDVIEYAVYGAPGELPALPDLQAAVGGALVDVVTEEVPDDWHERWKAFHRPVEVRRGDRALRVRPPWEGASADEGVTELVIDPGQAFGTGAHHTTRLCLELLLELEPGGACVDLGCGSGVLAIAAARLGWAPVLGVDHEAESVRRRARTRSSTTPVVEARPLRPDPRRAGAVRADGARQPAAPAASVGRSQRLHGGARPDALIASGLLAREADEVAAAFTEHHGLREADRRHGGEWAALLLVR